MIGANSKTFENISFLNGGKLIQARLRIHRRISWGGIWKGWPSTVILFRGVAAGTVSQSHSRINGTSARDTEWLHFPL